MEQEKHRLEIKAAQSVGADTNQIEFVPYLLQDLWELGSFTNINIELIKSINFSGNKVRVLDLGCGKGALAINIAKEFGYSVVGIDAFQSFIEYAQQIACELRVSNLTEFLYCDIKEYVKEASNFDLVILSSVGAIWGTWLETILNLKKCVKENAFLIIDEGFVDKRTSAEFYLTYQEIINQFQEAGMEIQEEIIIPREKLEEENKKNNILIRQRAEELIYLHPDKADILRNYVASQISETVFLESHFQSAVWLLKKI